MKLFIKGLLCAVCAMAAFSCADNNDVSYDDQEDKVIEAWVRANVPGARRMTGEERIWVEWFTTRNVDERPQIDQWVMADYNMRIMGNDRTLIYTRYEYDAKIEGTYTKHTHYAPHYLLLTEPPYYTTTGMRAALNNMGVGDSARFIIPSSLAYGSSGTSFSGGYQGQYGLNATAPVDVTIRLTEVVADPAVRELAVVKNYVDTYMPAAEEILDEKKIYVNPLEDMTGKKEIKMKDTVSFYYETRIAEDRFLVDTNIDSVALRVWHYDITSDSLAYIMYEKTDDYDSEEATNNAKNNMIEAFYRAFKSGKVGYDSWFEMVFTSDYGYGFDGSSDSSPVIQSYTPLYFKVYIMAKPD